MSWKENKALQAWLATRPPAIRALVEEFPPGTGIEINGVHHWVVAYDEDVLHVSLVNPFNDYDKAVAERMPICVEHVRRATRIKAH